jgi:hypothetical protein
MQLKPGMRGIIIKPKPCCGYTGGIGKLVVYEGKCNNPLVRCTKCSVYRITSDFDVYVVINGVGQAIDSGRVKWFNDDIDLEDTTEEVTKELEDATQ